MNARSHAWQRIGIIPSSRVLFTIVSALCIGMAVLFAPVLACSTQAWGSPDSSEQDSEHKQGHSAFHATISVENNSLALPDQNMQVVAHIDNTSNTSLTLTTLLLRTSRAVITDADTLVHWFRKELPSFYIESASSVQFPHVLQAHESIDITLTVTPQQRGWDTSQYGWGAHGLELLAYADTPEGSVHTSDRTVAVAAASASIQKFPVAAAIVCEADTEDLSSTPSPFDQLLTHKDSAHASAEPSSSSVNNHMSTALSEQWDRAGVNLFYDPVRVIDTVSHSSETNSNESGSKNADSARAIPLTSVKQASLFSTPAYDADIAALTHTDQEDLLTSISEATQESRNTLAVHLPSFDSSSTSSPQHYVPLTGTIDQQTLQSALNLHSGIPIVSSNSLREYETFYFPDAYGEILIPKDEHNKEGNNKAENNRAGNSKNTIPALVAHDGISSLLNGTLYSYNRQSSVELSETDIRAALVAYSAIIYNQAPSFSRSLLAMSRTDCSQTVQADRINSLFSLPWLTPVSLDDISASHDPYEWRLSSDNSANDSELSKDNAAQLHSFIVDSQALASALPPECRFEKEAHSYALSMLNRAWRKDPDKRESLLAGLDVPSFVRRHVVLRSASDINLIAQSSNLPLRVHSDLAQPLTVVPVISSPDQRIQADQQSPATVDPQSSTVIKFPIKAQGSGSITIRIKMTTPQGLSITDYQGFRIRLHPQWETRGTVIIAGLLILVFIIGIVHSLHEGRRSRPVSNEEFTRGLRRARHAHMQSHNAHEHDAHEHDAPQDSGDAERENHNSISETSGENAAKIRS